MSTDTKLVNTVASKAIVSLDLEKFIPPESEVVSIDLANYLFKGLVLKEKDFRADLKSLNLEQYREKYVCLYCSTDAIIPIWAFMLFASKLQNIAKLTVFGNPAEADDLILNETINKIGLEKYKGQRVVLKGCGERALSPASYVKITTLLTPVVKSLMFGEPCSTVPIFKQSAK